MNVEYEIKRLGGGTGYIQKITNETQDLNGEAHYVFINAPTTTSALTLHALGPNDIRKVEVYTIDATVASAVNYNSTALYTFTAGASSTGTVAVVVWDGTTWRNFKYQN